MSKNYLSDAEVFGASASANANYIPENEVTGPGPDAPVRDRTTMDVVGDVGVTALKGAIGLPQAAAGLLDIPTMGYAGKALDYLGYRPDEAQKIADSMYSEPQQAANAKVRQAEGFLPTLVAAVENPSAIATTVGESLPQMLGGAGVARGLISVAPKVAPWLAGAIGEGVIGAGSAASQIRNSTDDGLLTLKQSGAAIGSGVGTAAFGAVGGKLAQKTGLTDINTLLASGGKLASSPIGFARQVIGSGISEGVFEELPQSVQEQMWQNYATNKPLTDGVGNSAAMGMLAGLSMGGAAGGYSATMNSMGPDVVNKAPPVTPPEPVQPPSPPMADPAAEKSLLTPKALTALDRVGEIDSRAAELQTRSAELNDPEAGYGSMFDQERQELIGEGRALEIEREGITQSWPKTQTGLASSFTTEAGVRIEADYALMDAADLTTSHDVNLRANPLYPTELQPRDRDRAASEIQVSNIAQRLDPARLGLSADAANGAPIVGADGLVESGNARTIALRRVYQANGQKAADYKQFLTDNAAQFGLTPDAVSAVNQPVLVRVRKTPVNRAEFARQANASTVAQMSPSEQAKSDSARIESMEDLAPDDNGDFNNAASRPFVRRFMARLPVTEQAGMMDSSGNLSTAGHARVRNAVLAKAYGDSPVLQRMVESMDDNLRNVSRALMLAAPKVAGMRQAVKEGSRFDADLTPDLMLAVEELSRLKDNGASLQDALAQTDLLGDKYSPESTMLLQFLNDNMRRPRRMAEFIGAYMDALDAAGDPKQGSLLGDSVAPAISDLINSAQRTTQDGQPTTGQTQENTQRGDAAENASPVRSAASQSENAPGNQGGNKSNGLTGPTPGQRNVPEVTPTEAKKNPAPAAIPEVAPAKVEPVAPLVTPAATPTPVNQAALDRIAKGTAFFGTPEKAGDFIAKNGLTDTHLVEQTGKVRFEVKVKAVEQSAAAKPAPAAQPEVVVAKEEAVVTPTKPKAPKPAPVEAPAPDDKAKWLKAINDQNRTAGETGVQLMVSDDGKLTFMGDPKSTKAGRGLEETLKEARKAGATNAEIIASIRGAKARPTVKDSLPVTAPPAQPDATKAPTTTNTIFTEDAAAAARARLKSKLGRLNSGLDPETMMDGITLAGYHIEKGARSFAAFTSAMVDDLGDAVKPYLKSWYMGVKFDPRAAKFDGMDSAAAVEGADIETPVADQSKPTLAASLFDAIQSGNMPKDNPALKKLVEAFDGKPADPTRMKAAQEQLETAIVMTARAVVTKNEGDKTTFDVLERLYNSQPNLNIRTSTSIANQAYSTPAPLAFIASRLAGVTNKSSVLEPTAGNGMLLIGANIGNTSTNEINDERIASLESQGFTPSQKDATEGFTNLAPQDAIVTNPPFGSVKDANGKPTKVKVDGYDIGQIDHLIAARALAAMKDDGGAVLIIGANKVAGGLNTDDRIFFNWLYGHYNVTGHFEVDGDLYTRQGASWPVRVIVIKGRSKSNTFSPLAGTVKRVNNWSDVYEQYQNILATSRQPVGRPSTSLVRDGAGKAGPVNLPVPAGSKTTATDRPVTKGSTVGAGNVSGTSPRVVSAGTKPAPDAVGTGADEQRLNAQPDGPRGLEPTGTAGSGATRNQPAKPTGAATLSKPGTGNQFQAPYIPRSSRKDEGVLIPTNMAQPTQDALSALEDEVGDIDEFARKELGYTTTDDLHAALMGLQVDSVATAIYQIKKGKAVVIADQTGIGKGRQAAAIIRWTVKQGYTPVFISVKPSLFTDMYGDLADIGTDDVQPFVMNGDAWVAGADGGKLFANKPALHKRRLEVIESSGKLPDGTNAVFMTYSQINKDNLQRRVLMSLAPNAVFVLDESHNAAGASSTGEFVISALELAKGVTYLSATYAKRPDNMPLYFKTDIGNAAADTEGLAQAMAAGGLPLQTVVSNNLVKAGQMFRRERSYDGVQISSVFDTKNRDSHEQLSNEATKALRALVSADKSFHSGYVKSLGKELSAQGESVQDRAGNQASAGVQHTEFSSVVHNFVKQMLLGLKAQSAADEAIASLKRGEKPIIAVESTMGSFLNEYAATNNIPQGGELGAFDYRTVLSRALERTRVIIIKDAQGNETKRKVPMGELDANTREAYQSAQAVIDGLQLSIPVSPIDWMRSQIIKAGYSVAEITGRNLSVDYSNPKTPMLSAIDQLEQSDKVNTTRQFNGGKLDALILNVAGSTGISLHASEKFTDQRQRHMIVAQAAGDINIFMQMLGRIHRTGQVALPKYTILSVDLPTEKRPTAVLSIKMKSLNANTSSNTESATSVKTSDILNKYGDQIVTQYLLDNYDLAVALDVQDLIGGENAQDDIARKVTGRLALQPIEVQHAFYDEVEGQYNALIEYLNKTNQNDLEPRTFDFDAKETRQEVLFEGPDKTTPFGEDAIYGEYSIKAQGIAMKPEEIREAIKTSLEGKEADAHVNGLVSDLLATWAAQVNANRAKNGLVPGAFDAEKYGAFMAGLYGKDAAAGFVDRATKQIASGQEVQDVTAESMANTQGTSEGMEFMREHAIGKTFRIDINSEPYNAVITNIRSTHKSTGSPFSLSKVQLTVSVNGALRSLTIPGTQFKKIVVSSIQTGFRIEQLFKEQPPNQRETAKIITGNLLAAYGEIEGARGTIISFTKEDGTTEQGILLPKLFDYSKNTRGDYRLSDGAMALRFLQQSENKDIGRIGIMSRDGSVRVLPSGQGIRVQVPKSKAKGGKFFLDQALIEAGGDFVSSGNYMVSTVYDRAPAEAMLDLLMKKQALYALPSMAEEAKALTDAPAGTKGNDPRLSRGTGGGMDVAVLEKMATRIQARMPNMPKVNVLASPMDAPAALRDYIEQQGAMDDVDGAMHRGELYLFASGLPNALRAEHVLAEHEAAHFGLRAIFGDSLTSVMQAVYNNNAGVRQAATALQQRGRLTNAQATEEAIVDIPSSQLVKLKGWRKVVVKVRDWLADRGFTEMAKRISIYLNGILSQREQADMIVADLVRSARSYMAGKRGPSGVLRTDTMLSSILAAEGGNSRMSRAPAKTPAGSVSDRADAIINNKVNSFAPIEAVAKGLSKITGLGRLTSAIYDTAGFYLDRIPESIKAGVVSDYGVPEAVIDQRSMMQGRQRVQLRRVGNLVDKLSTLTRAESRVAYEWMNEQDPNAIYTMMQNLPEESVQILMDVQKMIDKLSLEAIRMGQLTQEAYDRNKFAYLRRSYIKHTLDQTKGEAAKRSHTISILGDQYKGRGLTESATMAQIQSAAPDWWERKTVNGKADTSLKGEKLVRLERRASSGEKTVPLAGMEGKAPGKLKEVHYFPAGEKLPAKYSEWTPAGTFEVRDIKGANAILWRDFTKEEREQMGEIDEARFAITKTLHAMVHDVEVGRYFEWLARTQSKAEGETIPGVVVEASERYRDTFGPDEWVKVPDSKIAGTGVKKYGKLADRYVPGPIWNDIRQMAGGQFKPLGDTYAKILTMWKMSKTALSPGVHMNNIMSNFVISDWHDVTASHTAKALRIIMGASDREGKGIIGGTGNLAAGAIGINDREAAQEIMTRYMDSGGSLGSWVTNEISRGQIEPMLAAMEKELADSNGASVQAQVGIMSVLSHLRNGEMSRAFESFKGAKSTQLVTREASSLIDLYQSEDEVFRLAAWLKAKEEGKNDMEAGKLSRRSFLDYNINAPWIKALRSSALPFVAFSYRAVPMMLEIAGKKPHKLFKLMAVLGTLNALGSMLAGGDDDEERKMMPEEKSGRIWGLVPKLVRMPWNDASNSPVYLDIRRFIPVGDVLDVGSNHAAIPLLPSMTPGGPLVMIAEVVLNKQGFTGREITLETDTSSERATKVLDYLYKAFMPNILGLPGSWATTGVMNAANGKTDVFGREQSVAQAVSSSFGVKLSSYPADVLRRNAVSQARWQTMEIDRNMSSLKRQRRQKGLDDAEFQAKMQSEQAKKRKVQQDLMEKMSR